MPVGGWDQQRTWGDGGVVERNVFGRSEAVDIVFVEDAPPGDGMCAGRFEGLAAPGKSSLVVMAHDRGEIKGHDLQVTENKATEECERCVCGAADPGAGGLGAS